MFDFVKSRSRGILCIYMIASIFGTVAAQGDRFLVVEAGGIGYRVFVTTATLGSADAGGNIKLFTYHHVSETASDLFGFPTLADVEFFEMLISVSGIGPKTALSVMNVARLGELKAAIVQDDATILTKVSGIGKKTAERIVLELRGKIDETDGALPLSSDDGTVIDALVSLGYPRSQARDAVRKVPATVTGISERVREALKHLGRHGE